MEDHELRLYKLCVTTLTKVSFIKPVWFSIFNHSLNQIKTIYFLTLTVYSFTCIYIYFLPQNSATSTILWGEPFRQMSQIHVMENMKWSWSHRRCWLSWFNEFVRCNACRRDKKPEPSRSSPVVPICTTVSRESLETECNVGPNY